MIVNIENWVNYMKLIWRGRWNGGEITLETDTLDQLFDVLEKLSQVSKFEDEIESGQKGRKREYGEYPQISAELGCSDAIRELLRSEWGRVEPRTMAEITNALETNAIYYPTGTLSGALTKLTKKKEFRRTRKNGKWAYVISK